MKKLWMIAIAGVFFFASCGSKTPVTEPEQQQEHKCCKELTEEQKADFAAWENWANLTDETAKVELVGRMKAFFDEKIAEKAEKCDAEQKEMCPEKAAKCAEFKAKWDSWETLTIEEQHDLIDAKMKCCCNKEKCEKAEGEGECAKAE